MITSVLPVRLYTDTLPLVPSFTVTALGITSPGVQFKLDAVGLAAPVGHKVRYDDPVVSATVTFRTTASAFAGTPAVPPTVTSRLVPAPHGVEYGPTLDEARLSSTRTGANELNPSPELS